MPTTATLPTPGRRLDNQRRWSGQTNYRVAENKSRTNATLTRRTSDMIGRGVGRRRQADASRITGRLCIQPSDWRSETLTGGGHRWDRGERGRADVRTPDTNAQLV